MMAQLLAGLQRLAFTGIFCIMIASFIAIRAAGASPPSDNAKSPHVISASDKDAIQAAMAHEIKVVGTVGKIQETGEILTIRFKGAEKSGMSVVVLEHNREAIEKAYGEALKSLDGKRVQVAGKLVDYREKPQIVVSRPEQITLVDEPKSADTAAPRESKNQPAVINATDKEAIDAALPHEVTVEGTVSEIKDIEGAIVVNFKEANDSKFYAVVLKRNREALEDAFGKELKSIKGKKVQTSGKVVEYRDKPEIIVSAAKKIVILDK